MRLLRNLFLMTAVVSLVPFTIGCTGGDVDSSPATEASPDEGDSSTDGMTDEEAAEFEAGEQ